MNTDTDRELLELAAKAAGIEGAYESWTGQGFKDGIRQILNGAKCQRPWNPLTDDGDALRLAVRLNISIHRPVQGDSVEHWGTYADHGNGDISIKVRDESDALAATRRAIVQAAASIGRAMP